MQSYSGVIERMSAGGGEDLFPCFIHALAVYVDRGKSTVWVEEFCPNGLHLLYNLLLAHFLQLIYVVVETETHRHQTAERKNNYVARRNTLNI